MPPETPQRCLWPDFSRMWSKDWVFFFRGLNQLFPAVVLKLLEKQKCFITPASSVDTLSRCEDVNKGESSDSLSLPPSFSLSLLRNGCSCAEAETWSGAAAWTAPLSPAWSSWLRSSWGRAWAPWSTWRAAWWWWSSRLQPCRYSAASSSPSSSDM